MLPKKTVQLLLLCLTLFLSACSNWSDKQLSSEKEEREYQRAQRLTKIGRFEEAMAAYTRVIDSRRDAPESHLELGRIYLEHVEDPISAIYHFRKFLEIKPNVEQSPMVKQMIETAQKAFARSLPGRPIHEDTNERLDLMEMVKQLRSENLALKAKIQSFQKQQPKKPVLAANEPMPTFAPVKNVKVPARQVKHYTVQEGDSLSKISSKVYGTVGLWEKIYGANRDILKSAHDLRVGQVLKIPSKSD